MNTPSLCIYHATCADGFSAAWSVWKKFPAIKFHAASHGSAPPDVEGHDVVIVDFSYKRPVMEEICAKAKSVTVLDHHKSAEEDLRPLFERGLISGLFDMHRSGAMIAWNYFHPHVEPPQLLKHVQDRDLWRFELPGTEDIQAALFSYEYEFETWDLLMSIDVDKLRQQGHSITRKHNKDVKEIIATAEQRMYIGGHWVPVVNIPHTMASEAGNLLCKENPTAPFAATYYDKHDMRRFSLRSLGGDGSFDVSAIAKMYGGGGHRNAAGFEASPGWTGELPCDYAKSKLG